MADQTAVVGIVAAIATQILALDDRIKRIDQQIREAFRNHPQADIIESLPGMGPILGAEFIVAAGDLAACQKRARSVGDAGRQAREGP
ncbi:hypothetical protein ACFYRC_09385 [Streptomyces sp. NPDC005279]|uniref:hypothetical protein n=1 Tax=Streptomyces sp. NPDC005279 TaxID=3364712 RepID=UPI003692DF95